MRRTLIFLTCIISLVFESAAARDYKVGSIDIAEPWSRATPRGASVAAGYMKLTNGGTVADRLLSGSSEIARTVEVHEMSMDNGVAKMRPVKAGLEIKPGETVELKPGSLHVMFVGLKKPLMAGDHVKATLVFEKAGPISIEYDVRAIGSTPGADMPGMQMPGH